MLNPVLTKFATSALYPIGPWELKKLPPDPRQSKWEPYTNFTRMVTRHPDRNTTWHPQRTRWGSPWPGGTTGVKQSALGVQSPGRGWAGRREVPLEWRRAVGVEPGAWRLWASAACEEERERLPWLGAGAGVPSSPSWGCKAGYPVGKETCEAVGACGGDATAGKRRGCARWGQLSRGRASGCCGWSIQIRCRCRSASQPRRLLRPRQRGISPLRPQCCRGL